MRNRIIALLEAEKINPAKFAEVLGVQRSAISHIMSGRNLPSLDMLTKILQNFPNVSAEWLLRGNSKMYTNSNDIHTIRPLSEVNKNRETAAPQIQNVNVQESQQVSEPEILTMNESQKSEPITIPNNAKNSIDAKQIVIFYPDSTFEVFHPR